MRGCVSAFAFEGATRGWVLAGEGRLVQNTRQLTGPEADEELEYGSFAVAPVYAGNSLLDCSPLMLSRLMASRAFTKNF